MEPRIEVDAATCIRCGHCVRICPSLIFRQPEPGGDVEVVCPESCIACGHCAAVCPTGAVRHALFPPERLHAIDRAVLPSPDALEELIAARRSNRAFSDRPVPHESLERIIRAAHYAPTASNRQEVAYTLVTRPETLAQVTEATLQVFTRLLGRLENPLLRPVLRRLAPDIAGYGPVFRRLLEARDMGRDLILRGATALILIHTPRANRFGCADANLAYQNASLMAESLKVSQFYTGFVCSAVEADRNKRLNALLGIEGTIHAGMALGMPEFGFLRWIEREKAAVDER